MGKLVTIDAVVSKVNSLLKYKRKVRIDNAVFVLHKITSGVLFALSLIVSSNFYATDPIQCFSSPTVERVINAYCWIHATYTLPEKLNTNDSFAVAAHPGVGPLDFYSETENTAVHTYYQWVWLVLFFQALAFYAPRYIWKNIWEGGRVKAMTEDLDKFLNDEETKAKRRRDCLIYFRETIGHNDGWSMKYAFCEVLNFINVVVQIDLTDRFLGRAFSTYGLSLLDYSRRDPMNRIDAMAVVFPTVTKCTFPMVGPTGNIINYDALCVLPINVYNEKFYPVLWYWFIILAVISGLALVYRCVTYIFHELRFYLLCKKFQIQDQQLPDIYRLHKKLFYGDWFTLYLIGKNMTPNVFLDFLRDLAEEVLDSKTVYPKAASVLSNGSVGYDEDESLSKKMI